MAKCATVNTERFPAYTPVTIIRSVMKISNVLMTTAVLLLIAGGGLFAVTQEDVVGYWTHEFTPGFNLVSFPVLPNEPTPENVFGDRLGDVEITTWDRYLGGYRWAKYDSETSSWTGDLYLLNRGTAYWINLLNTAESVSFRTAGKPEKYSQLRWENVPNGWSFFAPTYGQDRNLSELPPDHKSDLITSWNSEHGRFELAQAMLEGSWYTAATDKISADQAYLIYLNRREIRRAGPPTQREDRLNRIEDQMRFSNGRDDLEFETPPLPLVVGNKEGMPVCLPDGSVCTGGFTVKIIREVLRLEQNGQYEPYAEFMGEYFVPVGNSHEGKFRMTLTVDGQAGDINPGDRVYLEVRNSAGATTRSTSFEVPSDRMIIGDLSFEQPMSAPGVTTLSPTEFALGTPFPNPFNDRFQIDIKVPQTALVSYAIYDIRGRKIEAVERPFSAGTHRLSFEAGKFTAGIYLLEVRTGNSRRIAKVANIK